MDPTVPTLDYRSQSAAQLGAGSALAGWSLALGLLEIAALVVAVLYAISTAPGWDRLGAIIGVIAVGLFAGPLLFGLGLGLAVWSNRRGGLTPRSRVAFLLNLIGFLAVATVWILIAAFNLGG